MNGKGRPCEGRPETPAKKSAGKVYVPAADSGRIATLTALAGLLRDEGIARANEATDQWWGSCFDTAVEYLASTRIPFTADDVREMIPAPDHPNRVGARFNAAYKAGRIAPVGYALSRSRSRHAGVLRLWSGCDAA